MKAGSLCSGIGGLDLAAEALGYEAAWQVEADPWRRDVLAARWPEVACHGDIKEVSARDLEPVDLVVAGPPCQPISNAGRRKAQADPRWLWEELARLLRDLRPGHVFLENPSALLGRGMGVVLGLLAACGYVGSWRCLRASDIGAPHKRDRVWILARLADAPRERDGWPWLGAVDGGQAVADADLPGLAERRPPWPPIPESAGDGQGAGGVALWPTPTRGEGTGYMSGTHADTWRPTLKSAANGLWPTPAAADGNRSSAVYPAGNPTLLGAALWPTPKGSASHYGQPRDNDRGDLQAAVLWPTPTASNPNEYENLDSWKARQERELAKGRNGNGMGTPLSVAVRLWATPKANDGGPDYAKVERYANGGPRGSASPSLPTQAKGALNPLWVEALMGYPEGWTDPTRADIPRRLWPHDWPAPPDLEHGSPQHPGEPSRTVVARTVPHRARRVGALGDSVVPQCAAVALQLLWASQAARRPA